MILWRFSSLRMLLLVGVIVGILSGLLFFRMGSEIGAQAARGLQLRKIITDMETGASCGVTEQKRDWFAKLGSSTSAETVSERIREVAETNGVVLQSLGFAETPAAQANLGRLVVDIDAHGTYSANKGLLIDLLSREPGKMYLQGLSLHRSGNPSMLDAHLQVVWISRPTLQEVARQQ